MGYTTYNIRKIIFPLAVTCFVVLLMSGCNKKETYTVTFDANGGTGTMETQTFTEGEAQALTRNAFTYDGYTFSGWNTVQSGSGASYTDGQTITATADMTLYAQWASNGTNPTPGPDPTPTPTTGTLNGHEWVDLGLPSGTKWATCNVGADTPESYGDYFAWGETTTKETYNWSTYRYSNGGEGYNELTKYCNNAEFGYNGFTDALTTLEVADDAAAVNWGSGWRMPTRNEMNELFNNCTHEWVTQNGVNGRKFTGSNGNSIFIPATGRRLDGSLDFDGFYGDYWSSSLYDSSPDLTWGLDFDLYGNYNVYGIDRSYGFPVRPVCM